MCSLFSFVALLATLFRCNGALGCLLLLGLLRWCVDDCRPNICARISNPSCCSSLVNATLPYRCTMPPGIRTCQYTSLFFEPPTMRLKYMATLSRTLLFRRSLTCVQTKNKGSTKLTKRNINTHKPSLQCHKRTKEQHTQTTQLNTPTHHKPPPHSRLVLFPATTAANDVSSFEK